MISVASALNVEVIEFQELRVHSGNNLRLPCHLIDCLAQVISGASALNVEVLEIQEAQVNSKNNLATRFRSPVLRSIPLLVMASESVGASDSVVSTLNVEVIEIQEARVNSGNNLRLSSGRQCFVIPLIVMA